MRTKLALSLLLLLAGCGTTGPGQHAPEVRVIEDGRADTRSELSMYALSQLGTPYLYGGSSPTEGFDCSGLVRYVYEKATGLKLPRTTYGLVKVGRLIETDELQPGDLVFYNTLSRAYSHVGIYLGERRFIHAPSSNGVVRIESMETAYWAERYNGARRLLPS